MRHKLGRLGVNYVLVDFETGKSRMYDSRGIYIRDGFFGSPALVPVNTVSLVQSGTTGVVFEGISGQEKFFENPLKALITLKGVPSAVYPLQFSGKTEKGTSYKQYIFCYPANYDVRELLSKF